ncbi:class I SAM-dependent methyltransferase family protein [Candidatus Woesearchaeota archaeon]|nr:class I SAM-dependent methyltransferase family protein [Candidatus Woesearchaeota archaeon]
MKYTLKAALKERLTTKELAKLVKGFDIVGDIAIIEIRDALLKKEKIIAQALLQKHKNIKVVCKKQGGHKGEFRLQNYKILAGERRKTTIYRENGISLELHIQKTYFSPRLSNDRLRIAKLVNPGESVLVMFSGIAPYCCVIAKNSKAREIVGIEKNPAAHAFALRNIQLNKLKNVRLYCGDVRAVIPKLKRKFDRVCMPLPKGGESFLGVALKATKKNGTLHFYDFLHEEEFYKAEAKLAAACKQAKRKYKILKLVRCGQQRPWVFRVRLDARIV